MDQISCMRKFFRKIIRWAYWKAAPADAGTQQAINWNLKLYGSRLAREMYEANLAPIINDRPAGPGVAGLASKLCEEADIESRWFVYWCQQLQIAPIYHRKVWEDCFALQVMHEAGMLREGVSALGFGTGEEPLPSYLASRGVNVLATDLDPDGAAGTGWIESGQHSSLDKLHKPELVARGEFDKRVSLRFVDMNSIPEDLHGKYDLVWSLCSLEHLGSTELACRFVEQSVRCLKPDGIAVHTTEFNLSSETDTITSGSCVLFTRPQIEALCERLRDAGYKISPVSYETGSRPLDQFIDIPPFPRPTLDWVSPNHLTLPPAPHLRLTLLGFAATSIALVIRRAG